MAIEIEGRRLFIARGARTQTLNICDADNERGKYEWIVRILEAPFPSFEEVSGFRSLSLLLKWLIDERGGKVEKQPPLPEAETAFADPPNLRYNPDTDGWTQRARVLIEHTLDQLVYEFLEFPYLHRVEHSLHTKFASMLSVQLHFSRPFPLKNDRHYSQTVHKEWPETKPRQASRRGSFDIAIIAPAQLKATSVDDFRSGRIPAPIVIEMGLDYDAAHLANDEEKLLNSSVRYPYLVHFVRERDQDAEAEGILCRPNNLMKTVFARTCRGKHFHKFIGTAITSTE